jgi:3D-(3,5/4)-trihydroxycyclohexane-1,2-dione acylhydrolase (decyclizing)
VPVDFVKNAESLGAIGVETSSLDEFRQALEAAKSHERTTLIYVRVDTEARVPAFDGWWDVPIAEISTEPGVNAAKEEYDEARQNQRYFAPGIVSPGE